MSTSPLPSNNISQLLYYTLLPQCPPPVLSVGEILEYTKSAPNKPSTYGTPDCTDVHRAR